MKKTKRVCYSSLHTSSCCGWFPLITVTSRMQVLWCHTPNPPANSWAKEVWLCSVSWRWSTVKSLLPLGPRGILQPQSAAATPLLQTQAARAHGSVSAYKEPVSTDVTSGGSGDCEVVVDTPACGGISLVNVFRSVCCFSISGVTLSEPDVKAFGSRCRILFAKQLFVDVFECW